MGTGTAKEVADLASNECTIAVAVTVLSSGARQYLLIVPSVLQSDSANTACVQLLNNNETVNLNVFLEYERRNVTVFQETVRRKNFFKCSYFMVPEASSNPVAYITISLKGATVNETERRVLAIQNKGSVVFVQTDKPIYKPGQEVLFRIVSLNTRFEPDPQTYPLVTVQDPQRNQIFQWRNVTSEISIVQLSFSIISEPILGDYEIIVQSQSGAKTSHYFSVEEFVLPKYDITISAPKTVSVENPDFIVKVCGMYTYGQPVQGKAQLSVCRNLNFYGTCKRDPVCESVNKELGKDGCLAHVFSSKTFELNRSGYWMNLDVKAIVTEKGTGIQSERSAYISVSRILGTVTFQNMDRDYKRGIPYCGQIKLVDVDDSPLGNEIVQLQVNNKNVGNYSTDGNGTAEFCIDTSTFFSSDISLRLIYKPNENCNSDGWLLPYYPEAYYSVQRFYSRTDSFVNIHQVPEELPCGQVRRIKVSYSLNIKRQNTAVFYFFVLVKNKIINSGRNVVTLRRDDLGVSKGHFYISLSVDPNMAPVATLLVYTLHPEREVVADTARFEIEKCFHNKVSLQFSVKEALPASNVSLHIKAAANSHCALRAVDQSVLLLKPETELSAESVYSLLRYDMFDYYFNGLNLEDDPQEPCIPPENIFYNGLYYAPANINYGPDIYGQIRPIRDSTAFLLEQQDYRLGNTLLDPDLNLDIQVIVVASSACPLLKSAPPAPPPPGDVSLDKVIETVRKFFPETWIWELFGIGSDGHAELTYIVPDTITEWKATAFCLEKQAGFGISKPATLIAFQPFFVDITLPYSIVRGEDFLCRVNVFNYLEGCIQVKVSMAQSQDFQAHLLSPLNDNGCVCGGERKTYIWNISAKKLGDVTLSVTAEAPKDSGDCGNGTSGGLDVGRKDTLIRNLLVEPEGIERELTQSSLICAKGAVVSEPVSLKLPENLVEGSARAYFSCIGDLMGTAMQNLHQLLRMPYGCGEQNMALFAPIIYVMEYLNATGQLDEETKSKSIGYLTAGYQRQLSYKHPDGSYSAFGSRDKEGNTWLTGFTYKSFARASHTIFIDPNVQTQSVIWLSSKQKSDGCFQNVGKLFNNAMKGGVQDELSLSAYITAALIESGFLSSHPVVRNALYCLEAGLEKGNITVYDKALLAYAFRLAGNKPKTDLLLNELIKSATKVGGSLFWEREDKPPAEESPSFYPRASSVEVEIAAYVLLALLTGTTPTPAQLTTASQIVLWLTKQQNPYGGFSSTQDTVVAIQALALFSQYTFSKDGRNSVRIHSNKPFERIFEVNNDNRLLLQRTSLPDVPGEYTVDVNGTGCVFAQAVMRYNVLLPKKSSGFFLSVQTANVSCGDTFQTKFAIAITARYTGKRNSSNMAIIDVKMLSGFVPDQASLQKLRDDRIVMKVESKENHVIIYLDDLSSKGISFSFIVAQDLPVSNLKPASVWMYDYYETDEMGIAEYTFPCHADDP
ncbi:ovostatin-like [Lacerta agilis]|uniref:ovostatin-like n=1 Tax=Lacerta agilis TaxID=80427 RepID=UPI00141A3F00|nr:ovostatin-like [Lacerta agilis]